MRMRCGIWERLGQQFGGTSEFMTQFRQAVQLLTRNSFLVKDAQADLQSARLKQ